MPNFKEIADGAKAFACTMYKNQPGALIPNPISSGLHLVWDSFCGDDPPPGIPLPPAPTPQFNGGQCAVRYEVKTNGFNFNSPTAPPTPIGEITTFVYGPITGTGASRTGTAGSAAITHYIIAKSSTGTPQNYNTSGASGGEHVWKGYTYIVSVRRLDGQPDNCGQPPKAFPDTSPPPPSGFTSPPTPVVINDNDTINITYNFKAPTMPSPPALALPPIVINYLSPSLNPEFNIPITFDFKINPTINLGGGGDGFGQPDRDKIENINNNTTDMGDKITNIKNEITNITNIDNNAPLDPDDFDPPVEDQAPGEYEQSYLAAVQVKLTKVPVNAKTQSGNTAPDVLYAGWFEWRQAGYCVPRQPIHFIDNVFLAPKGVDGFAFTLYTGYEGTATSIINKEKI